MLRHQRSSKWLPTLAAAAVLLGLNAQAHAGILVSYTTSGSFNVNGQVGSDIVLHSGNLTVDLSYVGTTQSNVAIPDATAPFGTFQVTVTQAGAANENVTGSFDLLLTQTDPTSAQGTFTADVSGKVKLDTNRQITITFDSPPNPISLPDSKDGVSITYLLPTTVTLNSPADSNGAVTTTDLTADISDPPVVASEPATLAVALPGLAVLALFLRRRGRVAA